MKFFASSIIWKEENPPFHRRNTNYDAGQESRTGTPKSSDTSSGEVINLHVRERRTDTVRDGRGGILQCRPPSDPK